MFYHVSYVYKKDLFEPMIILALPLRKIKRKCYIYTLLVYVKISNLKIKQHIQATSYLTYVLLYKQHVQATYTSNVVIYIYKENLFELISFANMSFVVNM